MTDENSLSNAARAAVDALNKANEARFTQLQEYNKMFKWTCFYFSGGDIADCCKANTEKVQRVLDPRLSCEMDIDKSLNWADFAVTYKVHQRFIYPGYEPLYQKNNTDTVEFFPGSFISACEYIGTCFGLDKGFYTEEQCARWTCILAGMVFLNKLDSFKDFALNVYGMNNDIIERVTARSLDSNTIDINVSVYQKALTALQRYVGLNAAQLKEIHGGFYNKSCSFLDSDSKETYLKLQEEYKAEVEKMYNIIKNVGELTLCWNNATVGDTFVEGDEVNSDVNINQFLNCCGEIIASDAGILSDAATTTEADIKSIKTALTNLAKRVTNIENTEELESKLTTLKIEIIVLIICIVVMFLMVCGLVFKIQILPMIKKQQFTNHDI